MADIKILFVGTRQIANEFENVFENERFHKSCFANLNGTTTIIKQIDKFNIT